VARAHRLPAIRAYQCWGGLRAASAMHQGKRRPLVAAQPSIPPSQHRDHHRIKVHPLFCQPVFDAGVVAFALGTFEDSVADERPQARGKDVARDSGVALELVETAMSHEGLAQNKHRPPLADNGERARHGTIGLTDRTPSHRSSRLPRPCSRHMPDVPTVRCAATVYRLILKPSAPDRRIWATGPFWGPLNPASEARLSFILRPATPQVVPSRESGCKTQLLARQPHAARGI